jgi:glycerophosphoryl diester phosphodiesterase
MKNPRIIYHRLSTKSQLDQLPLNLITGIECDLRMTRDGVIVVHHDRRVLNGDSRYYWIDKLTVSELYEVAGEVFTFDELLNAISKKGLFGKKSFLLDLDLKQSGMEKKISMLLKNHSIPNVLVCSPDIWALKSFEDVYPNVQIGLTYSPLDKWDLGNNRAFRYFSVLVYYSLKPFLFRLIRRKTKKDDIEVASIHHKLVNKQSVSFLHQYAIQVYAWGTDSEKRLKELVELGVDGIKTKKPDLLKKIL